MACNPTRISLSNAATTTVQVTLATDPGDGTTVTLEVDELGIDASATTSSAVASFTIAAVSAANNSIWDATIQVGSNRPATAEVLVTETNTAQTIGITIDDSSVTYCAPSAGGGGGGTGDVPAYVYSNMTTRPYYWSDIEGITPDKTQRAYLPAFSINGKIPHFAYGYNRTDNWDETAEIFRNGPKIESSLVRGFSSLSSSSPSFEVAESFLIQHNDTWSSSSRNPTMVTALSSKYGFDIGTMHRRWDGDSTIGETPNQAAIGTVYVPPHVNGSIQSVRIAFSRGIDGGTF